MHGVLIETRNYSGHVFSDFFVDRAAGLAPGWFVYGRNSEKYGTRPDGRGAYVSLCARPDVKPRRLKHWNGPVQRGWRTKAEAQMVADHMNRGKR